MQFDHQYHNDYNNNNNNNNFQQPHQHQNHPNDSNHQQYTQYNHNQNQYNPQYNQYNNNNQQQYNNQQYQTHHTTTSPNHHQSNTNLQPLLQSKSAPTLSTNEFSNILGCINHDLLDDFQMQLINLLTHAPDQSVITFFQKKSHILYRFIIKLFIVSLHQQNPLRSKSANDEMDLFTEFQNLFQIQRHSDSLSVSTNSNYTQSPSNRSYQPPINRSSVTNRDHHNNQYNHTPSSFSHQSHQMRSPPSYQNHNDHQEQYSESAPAQPPSALGFFKTMKNANNSGPSTPTRQHRGNSMTNTPHDSPSFGAITASNNPPSSTSLFTAPNSNNISFDISQNALPPSRQRGGASAPPPPWQQQQMQQQQQLSQSQQNLNNNNNGNNNYNSMAGNNKYNNWNNQPPPPPVLKNTQSSGQVNTSRPSSSRHSSSKSQTLSSKKKENRPSSQRHSTSTKESGGSWRNNPSNSFSQKSAQVLRNVVNKKKRKMKKLSDIDEEEEKALIVQAAEIVAPMTIVRGSIRIGKKTIAFIPDLHQSQEMNGTTDTRNLALDPPELERVTDNISFQNGQAKYQQAVGEDDKYWIAVNVASSYEQVGGTRYKLMNAKNVWTIDMITEIYYRRYQARNCAFELFFNDDTSWLFNVFEQKSRDICFNAIIDLKPPNLIDEPATFKNPKKAIKSSKIHHKWCTREISNFEYIMRINLLAGRTFNDLEQYPVVPWIIKDYDSNEIDLKNPKIYRDLTKPIGACNPERLTKFTERYELMTDDPSNRFMYGTHYSTKAIVLYFLIRMEPFTTYNKLFQGGKFDTADRLFDSIMKTWKGAMRSTSDVKELIPEFYYMTDFLQNKNNLDFGVTQNGGKRVDNVILPKWSKGSYEIFTKTMRNAFESEYVSRNLHHWIDLIFGYKQTGKEAELAFNVFHPYTYQDNVDLDKIQSEEEKQIILQIISEFGQTPMQIFKKPHRVRLKGTQVVQNIFKAKTIKYYGSFKCTESESHLGISYIAIRQKNVITISTDNTVEIHKFHSKTMSITRKAEQKQHALNVFNKRGPSLSRLNKNNDDQSSFGKSLGNVKNQIIKKTSNHLFLKNLCFAVTMDGYHLFAAGFEDFSFIQYHITHERIEEEYHNHSNIVSCLALDENERTHKIILVTGSYDRSIIVWKGKMLKKKHNRSISANYGLSNSNNRLELSLMYKIPNHDSEINCVDVSVKKDVIIAGTKCGSIYMYNSSKGDILWSTQIKTELSQFYNVAICRVSAQFGTVLCYCCNYDNHPAKLYLFSNNGQYLNEYIIPENDKYHEISFSKDGNNVCCGGLNKNIVVYNLPSFNIGRSLNDANHVIKHITTDKDEKYILSGLSNGNILLYSYPESAQKVTPKLPHRKSLYGVAGNAKKHTFTPFNNNNQ